jgi:8-oxo-dGTP pyrophosphatase MutT (NUDIX family)
MAYGRYRYTGRAACKREEAAGEQVVGEVGDMDVEIVAAIIGGAFAIFAAMIPIYIRSKRERMDLPEYDPGEGLSVAVGVVQKDKDFLMVKRKTREGNLRWQFPAGIVKPNTYPEDKVEREVKEETGITCRADKLIGSRVHSETKILCQYLHCTYLDGEAQNLDPEENDDVKWVRANEVESYATSSIFRGVKKLLAQAESGQRNA